MNIKLSEEVCRAIGIFPLKVFGVAVHQFEWQRYADVDLTQYRAEKIVRLIELLESVAPAKPRGVATALRDVRMWADLVHGKKNVRARGVKGFTAMLHTALYASPGHRVYEKDTARDTWWAYYVNDVEFHERQVSREGTVPEYCEVKLFYVELGGRKRVRLIFHSEDCSGMTLSEALLRKGYVLETPERRQAYLAEADLFLRLSPQIGKQFFAVGVGTTNLDGNKPPREDHWAWWRVSTQVVNLERGGEPSRVVVDVFRESDKGDDDDEDDRRAYVDRHFWTRKPHADAAEPDAEDPEDASAGRAVGRKATAALRRAARRAKRKDDEEEDTRDDMDADEDEGEDLEAVEIPLHPVLATFDLRRHLRLRIHVAQLTEYRYDPALGEKLVLPEVNRDLVDVLLNHKVTFRDIITGKGMGAIVLCAGPPGTGKTLTAEVYAEVTARPLYTVQCSQLGTDPDDLEDELLKVFARAQRWNAILLLDEADVYVAARGADLTQNAIVGVFLRVLEYYKGVMFLNTNRAELVDDAIASRCVARIGYMLPTREAQHRLWAVLAETAGVKLAPAVIQSIVAAHPRCSGRDVKNLLKLALMVAEARGITAKGITLDLITFVSQFKPTGEDTAP